MWVWHAQSQVPPKCGEGSKRQAQLERKPPLPSCQILEEDMEAELSKLLSDQSTTDLEMDPDVLAMQAKAAQCNCRSAGDSDGIIEYQGIYESDTGLIRI